jgi:hypothetical protein
VSQVGTLAGAVSGPESARRGLRQGTLLLNVTGTAPIDASSGDNRTAALELSYGAGPSYVNLPAPGCWTLDLIQSGHRDQVELWYTAS